MRKTFKAASALSLAIFAAATITATDVSFALEASDDIPETEIVVDPALLENSDADTGVVFAAQDEVVAEIPEDVIEADELAQRH